jgi:hypothetical protein
MDSISDPGNEAVGGDHLFQEEEQTMDTAKGQDCGRPSEEDGEENENILFEEEANLEGARVSPSFSIPMTHTYLALDILK